MLIRRTRSNAAHLIATEGIHFLDPSESQELQLHTDWLRYSAVMLYSKRVVVCNWNLGRFIARRDYFQHQRTLTTELLPSKR